MTEEGWAETGALIGETVGFDAVKVWHCNDAKAVAGSKLDRHEHIGEGTIGAAAFRRLLGDSRFAGAAFIAETPVDQPGDERRNVAVLRVARAALEPRRPLAGSLQWSGDDWCDQGSARERKRAGGAL